MDRALVGAGSGDLEDLPNPTTHCKLLTLENHQVLSLMSFFSRQELAMLPLVQPFCSKANFNISRSC
jgi:hypothetical protein